VEARINRGLARLDAGDAAGAEADLDAALAAVPDDAAVLAARGRAHLVLDDGDAALADADAAIRSNALLADGYVLRADVFRAREQWDLAIDDYTIGIRLVPDAAGPYEARAATLDAAGLDAAAEIDRNLAQLTRQLAGVDDALARVDALVRRATVWLVLEEWALALDDLDRVLAAEPDEVSALLLRATAHRLSRDSVAALADAEAALAAAEDAKDLAAARVERGLLKQSLGADAEARADYAAADNRLGLALLARLLRENDPTAAVEYAKRALAMPPEVEAVDDRWYHLETLALALAAAGDPDAAATRMQQAIDAAPDDVTPLLQAELDAMNAR
jgi:tetratricopeptide (TPR) repeat protein